MKPENVIILDDIQDNIRVKIIDFGFSCFRQELHENPAGFVCGTPNFIAPEIYSGAKHDYCSDVFSIGVIMYFMLTKELPFNSISKDEIVRKTLYQHLDFSNKIL